MFSVEDFSSCLRGEISVEARLTEIGDLMLGLRGKMGGNDVQQWLAGAVGSNHDLHFSLSILNYGAGPIGTDAATASNIWM